MEIDRKERRGKDSVRDVEIGVIAKVRCWRKVDRVVEVGTKE
jgi:hypothetical protein